MITASMIGGSVSLSSLTSPSCPPSLARIGGFVAPFIAGLGVRDPSLPFLIFGGAAVVSIIIFLRHEDEDAKDDDYDL